MIWVTTDSHWNHANIIKYENRPADFKERIITNWRAVVQDRDTVIHLGDVIFGNKNELAEILRGLPGIKVLTVGNHDKRTGTNSWFQRMGFNYVCKSHEYKGILFSHKPMDLSGMPEIRFNIHGHFHTNSHNPKEYPFYDTSRHVKVSVEELNYMPVKLDELVSL